MPGKEYMPETADSSMISEDTYKRPLMALRGITVFPGMVLTFDVERVRSIAALNAVWPTKKREILLVTQRDVMVDNPDADDLYGVGTVAVLRQFARMPDGSMSIMVVKIRGLNCIIFLKRSGFLNSWPSTALLPCPPAYLLSDPALASSYRFIADMKRMMLTPATTPKNT